MAILPLGTTNVLAKELGIPETVERSMDVAIKGTPRVVSLGKITLQQGSQKARYFCTMAGVGFDAMTVFGLNKTFKKIYPELEDFDLEVHHSVHYLGKLIDEGKITFDGELGKKVTYHDPCDLGRAFKIFEEPRNILKKIPGLQYVEMARTRLQARCCGGGGGVQAHDPDMAVEMAAVRVRDALDVGAEIIVSGCAACKDNLKKGAKAIPKAERGKIKIMDITEIVAKAI